MAKQQSQYELSLQSSLLFALYESYEIKTATSREDQARFAVEEAEAAYYPDIQVAVEVGPEYNDPAVFENSANSGGKINPSLDLALTLRQMIYDPGVVKDVMRQQQLQSSSLIEKDIVFEDVIEETITAYVDVWLYQNSVVAAAQGLLEIQNIHDLAKMAFESGGESRMVYDFVRARLALAESQYQTVLASYRDATNALTALTGPLPDFIAQQPEELKMRDYDVEFYKALAVKKNNELQLASSGIRTAEIDVEKQETEFLPKVNFVVEGNYGYDQGGETGAVTDGSAMFRMTYDIFKGGERKAKAKRLMSRVDELKFEKVDQERQLIKDVKSLYNDVMGLENSLSAKLNELESYFSVREIAEKAAEAGEINYMEIIENEENITSSFSEVYAMQADIYKQSYTMLKMIGALNKNKFCESC